MSAVVHVNIVCDTCLTDIGSSQISIGLARRAAKEEGWAFSRNKDVCPNCRKRKPKGWDKQVWEDTRNGNTQA